MRSDTTFSKKCVAPTTPHVRRPHFGVTLTAAPGPSAHAGIASGLDAPDVHTAQTSFIKCDDTTPCSTTSAGSAPTEPRFAPARTYPPRACAVSVFQYADDVVFLLTPHGAKCKQAELTK